MKATFNRFFLLPQLRSRQADEYRNLEEDYRQRHQRLHEAHEQEIQSCIRRYFAKNNPEQPEDLSLHRHEPMNIFNNDHLKVPPIHPVVTLAANNLLMPPVHQVQSAHSSNEDCSGCSYTVKHKLQVSMLFISTCIVHSTYSPILTLIVQEHLMQRHRRECATCSMSSANFGGGNQNLRLWHF